MNIQASLEKEHSRQNSIRIQKYIGKDKNRFAELIHIILRNHPVRSARAAWALKFTVVANPELLHPWIPQLLEHIINNRVHDAVKRNTLLLLDLIPIPETLEGKLTDYCFNVLGNTGEAVAIRVYAMSILGKMCQKYPELIHELKTEIESRFDRELPAYRSRGRKILKKISAL